MTRSVILNILVLSAFICGCDSDATSTGKGKRKPLTGDRAELWSSDGGLVPYTYTLSDLKRLEQLSTAKDTQGIQLMILSGQVAHTSSGTPCLVIDPGIFRYEVRLDTGEAIWTANHFVKEPGEIEIQPAKTSDKPSLGQSDHQAATVEDEVTANEKEEEQAAEDKLFRMWTSLDKNHSIEAKFLRYKKGIVYLEQRNGEVRTIKLTELTKGDQKHCRELGKEQAKAQKHKNARLGN